MASIIAHATDLPIRRGILRTGCIALICLAMGAVAHAETYPSRIIKIIVPFTPGGATDVVGRVVAQKLSERLKQPVVVENRPGAGGNVGAEAVARSDPDGYTLLAGALVAHAINATLQKGTARFDLMKDFAPISVAAVVPITLVVNSKIPAKTAQEFIVYAKERKGTISYASAGNGSTQHLAGELFKSLTGTQLNHVPYRGSAPAMNDVIGGQIDCTFETGPVVISQVEGKTVRPLLIANEKRLPEMPDVPTSAEVGVPRFQVSAQYGFLAPAGTPEPIVELLNREINAILQLPDVKEKLSAQGALVELTTPAAMKERLREEIAKWAKVIADNNIETQ